MDMANNSLFLFAAILLGAALQQIPIFLKRGGKQRAASHARPLVMGYWLALGVILIVEGATRLSSADVLPGVSSLALGLGLMLAGLGQTLGWAWLRVTGVAIIAVGPTVVGIQFILAGSDLNGLIVLALGLGILVSALRGWIGGIGRMVVGALLLGSGVMLLLEALVQNAVPSDTAVVAIGATLIALSLWGIIGGGLALIRAARPPRQATSRASEDISA